MAGADAVGRLILCGTPIGNLGDASVRLAEVLADADVVFAEDTRRARVLLDRIGVTATLESFFTGNEAKQSERLDSLLRGGATVALVTDAGMPSVSDPGARAVEAARGAGATISVVPGPSAALAALSVSGLPGDRVAFEGFLPRKGAERKQRLADLALEERTMVLFLATSRVVDDLAALADALGEDRVVVVARELTKLHEEIWHGTLAGAISEWTERRPRGEFTVVVAGRPPAELPVDEAVDEVLGRAQAGEPMSEVVREVAERAGVRRRALYEAVLRAQDRA